jgi:hypothetical protein
VYSSVVAKQLNAFLSKEKLTSYVPNFKPSLVFLTFFSKIIGGTRNAKDGRITKEENGHPTNHKVPNWLKPEDPGVSWDDSYYFGSGTKEIGIRVTHTFKSITSSTLSS